MANIVVDGQTVQIGLWDTAGKSDYDRLRPLSYPQTDVFLICCSLIEKSSFENVKAKWIPELQHHAPGVPYIIVGTKSDLRFDEAVISKVDKVYSTSEGTALAKEVNAHCYMECSALTQDGIKDLFEEAARAAIKYKNHKRNITNRKCLLL